MSLESLITVYRFLSRNIRPPEHLIHELQQKIKQPIRPLCPGGVALPLPDFPSEHTFGTHNVQFTSFSDLSGPNLNSFDKSRIKLPPSSTSVKTLQQIAEIRETRILDRIVSRKQELTEFMAMVPPEVQATLDPSLKAIDLIPLQRRLRVRASELLTRINRVNAPPPSCLSLAPLYTPSESLSEEKNASRRRKQKRAAFLDSILTAHKKYTIEKTTKQRNRMKISRSVVAYLQAKDKKEAMEKERGQRERLRLLKANDVEAYMNLVQEHKKDRLLALIQQTENYLQSIGAMVESERTKAAEELEKEPVTEIKEEMKKKTYYTIAHKIEEEVVGQPDSLEFGQLKGYQIEGLKWLVSLFNNKLNGILADEMGLGKTIQTIALITYLYEKKNVNGQFLIIVPLSTVANWQSEFARWAPHINVIRFTGAKDHRKQLYKNVVEPLQFQVCITTFDFIIKDKKYLSKVSWLYIIVDEGHRMKNSACKLTTILRKDYASRHRVLLTGTPLQNSLPELWSLLNWLLPNIFSDVGSFQNWFAAPFDDKREQDIDEEEELLIINRLHQVLRPFLLRRLKSDVEDQLPGKKEVIIKVPLSAWQSVLYTQIQISKTAAMTSVTGKTTVKGMQNTLMQLRKVCNHPWVFFENGIYDVDPGEDLIRVSGKFVLLDRVLPKLKATGHKVLIFTQMVQIMDYLSLFLSYRGYQHLRLDGSTKADDRGTLLTQFNDPEAGGLGLNLQAADTVIIFDSDWNPQADLQAQDRAHRLGQTNEVRVLRLCTTTPIEENILSKAHHKLDIDSKIIQAGLYNPNATNEERKAALEDLLHRPSSSMTDVTLGSRLEEVNRQLARSDEELEIFTKMDEDFEGKRRIIYQMDSPPPELITMEELPDWLVNPPKVRSLEDDLALYGRGGKRRAAAVKYTSDEDEDDEYIKAIIEEYISPDDEELQSAAELSDSEEGSPDAGVFRRSSGDEELKRWCS
ncbi:hypothetical protein GEMRC1_009039 [Eukaryota sp. GEM-RC1]